MAIPSRWGLELAVWAQIAENCERRSPPGATAGSSPGSHGCRQGLVEARGCGRVWPGWWRRLRHEGWTLGRQKRGHGVHGGPSPSFQLSFSLFFLKKLMFIGVELLYKVMLLLCCKAKLINSTNTYIPPFWISSPFRSPQSAEWSSLSYTVGSH